LSSDNRDFEEGREPRSSWAQRLRRVPRAVRLVVVVSVGALLLSGALALGLWSEGYADRADRLARELDHTRMAVDTLQRENLLLRAEVDGLREDPRVMEKAARDVLGYVRDGDVVIYVDEALAPPPHPGAEDQ
jgi:cell division protein FtsB